MALSRVGDMFKFGRSTRMYILGGPTELMPEEGLTKKQMLAMKALEARTLPNAASSSRGLSDTHKANHVKLPKSWDRNCVASIL